MKDLLPYLVIGVTTGSVYGIAGMGLVLTFKSSGLFNFAHGSVAACAGYVFYELRDLRGLPWPVAAALAVLVVAPLFGFALERLSRGLGDQPVTMRIVASVGLLGALTAVVTIRYGAALVQISSFLPTDTRRIVGVNVGIDQLITTAIGAALCVGLWVLFRVTRLGLAMRAVVEDASLVALSGTSPTSVRRWSWLIGSTFAAISGILLAPIFGLDANLLTLVVVYAFGAAAIGAFSSLPLTYLGGLAIGILTNVSSKYVVDLEWLRGLPPSLPFVVLSVALLATTRRRLVDADGSWQRTSFASVVPGSRALGRASLAVLAGLLVMVPGLVGPKLPVYSYGLILVILFLSLRLLVLTSGQVSLCHAAFAAVGAASFAHLTTGLGVPWFPALALAGCICVPIGAVVALPAIRLSGLYLAVGTLGFGILVEQLLFTRSYMFGQSGSLTVARPTIPFLQETTDTVFYYVILGVVVLSILLVHSVHRSRLGRMLRVLSLSPVALSTSGASPNVARFLVFSLSAFMAGVSGALSGALFQSINGASFTSFQSMQWLTVAIVAGARPYGAPFIAGFLASVLPSYIPADQAAYAPIVYGGFAIVYALRAGRGPVRLGPGFVDARLDDRLARRSPVRARLAPPDRQVAVP